MSREIPPRFSSALRPRLARPEAPRRQKDCLGAYRGPHHRGIGKVLKERDQAAPKTFLVGADQVSVEAADDRLEALGEEAVAEYQEETPWPKELRRRSSKA